MELSLDISVGNPVQHLRLFWQHYIFTWIMFPSSYKLLDKRVEHLDLLPEKKNVCKPLS